jgi:hypothetical protein
MRARSAFASATVMPVLSRARPKYANGCSGSEARSNRIGPMIRSASVSAIRNPSGMTPTISVGIGFPFRVSVRPITAGSPPKRRCQ